MPDHDEIYSAGGKNISLRILRTEIEAVLHPYPLYKDVEIRHRHKPASVVFSAWRNDKRQNDRYVIVGYLMMYKTGKILTTKNLKFLFGD